MSGALDDALESTIDDSMRVDMDFLEAHRRGGKPTPEKALEIDLDAVTPEEHEHERPAESGASAQRGGSASGGNGTAAAGADQIGPGSDGDVVSQDLLDEHEGDLAEAALEDSGALAPAPSGEDLDDELTPSSIRLTDHQDAVQNASSATRGGSGDGDSAVLPQSGFHLSGQKSQPNVKSLPNVVISTLREHLRAAAIRELGVTEAEAREFIGRMGQGALVTAFLLAKLDLTLEADPATLRATALFRSQDPLLGRVAERIMQLERLSQEQNVILDRLRTRVSDVQETTEVIEQLSAYVVADRTENFLRGSHTTEDAPLTHKTAVTIRDKAREATKKQRKLEREREGRPIR